MRRKLVISFVSILAIALVVACQQPKPAPPPLKPDPELLGQWVKEKAQSVRFKLVQNMTAAHVAELEAMLVKNPDDREARQKLMDFYYSADFKHKVVSWDEKLVARRRHVLWAIAHDPGGSMLQGWRTINPAFDPAGYAQAKKLWLEATSKKDVALPVLRNAASFFQSTDKPLVESILLRAEAMDPGGPNPRVKGNIAYPSWSGWLGSLYARSIIEGTPGEAGPSEAPAKVTEADRAFATEARSKLDKTTDVTMLMNAADALVESFRRRGRFDTTRPFDSELGKLGFSYLDRAMQLDPKNISAHRLRAWVASVERSFTLNAALKNVPKEKQEEAIRALPHAERLQALCGLSVRLRGEAGSKKYEKDPAGAKALWARSKEVAEEALKLADSRPNDPARGTAIFAAHLSLGQIALHENDLATAVKHLEAAGSAPPSDDLKYGQPSSWQYLVVDLLKRGERESVARFLDRVAAMSEVPHESLDKAAAQIRAGTMPPFYQYQTVAR